MSASCCGTSEPHDHAAFACHRCGACCTNLRTRWGAERGTFAPAPAAGVYRLATPGGLRMFAWETAPFRGQLLAPLLVVADAARERLVALAYELDASSCPKYAEGTGCTVYAERPVVCQAFPLLLLDGARGPEAAVSALCPARVPVVVAARVSTRPEAVVAAAYPGEAPAAMAVPVMTRLALAVVGHLERAGVVRPMAGLDEKDLAAWAARGVLDLVEVVESTGTWSRSDLLARGRSTVDAIRRRWVQGHSGASRGP